MTRLLMSGPIAREILGKTQEGVGLLSTTRESLEKYQMTLLFPDFLGKIWFWEMAFGNADPWG